MLTSRLRLLVSVLLMLMECRDIPAKWGSKSGWTKEQRNKERQNVKNMKKN
uniref:Uncharacterized protein n=1 Tax=Solanum lycopersicum TaxID=4081 RepID=A0A3Q7IRS7_SOLLC